MGVTEKLLSQIAELEVQNVKLEKMVNCLCDCPGQLTWTKTRPRKPGFYFYKRRSMQVVKIEWRGRDDEPWLHCVSIGQPVDFLDGQWAGPIPEPVEEKRC